jgi:hypothetical protein
LIFFLFLLPYPFLVFILKFLSYPPVDNPIGKSDRSGEPEPKSPAPLNDKSDSKNGRQPRWRSLKDPQEEASRGNGSQSLVKPAATTDAERVRKRFRRMIGARINHVGKHGSR